MIWFAVASLLCLVAPYVLILFMLARFNRLVATVQMSLPRPTEPKKGNNGKS